MNKVLRESAIGFHTSKLIPKIVIFTIFKQLYPYTYKDFLSLSCFLPFGIKYTACAPSLNPNVFCLLSYFIRAMFLNKSIYGVFLFVCKFVDSRAYLLYPMYQLLFCHI